ncbi:hypothetical protein [Dokdonia sp. Hel_I_53]|uniref:hypothetical protein n=1 Tax=Dokdonia sp. Hel_I_53 TaxID=1566287 RepID=UPI00119AAE8C|nr:hypothetical protein [Dokdonia sp. Hel_I_53]TVZ51663.1 hypothetical protein OD90_0811 [Dokdonia sp. Hel_I_53]
MKIYITLTAVLLTLSSCSDANTHKITQDTVGPLSKSTTINDLSIVFKNDSLVDDSGSNDFRTPQGEVTVFEKGGKKLLKLTPQTNTKESKVKYIQVFDDRYETDQGITLKSTFKDIQNAYTIRSIENLIGAIVIFVNESDAYFTIDKKHLPGDLKFNTSSKIELSQIPDDAPIKYLQIGWE